MEGVVEQPWRWLGHVLWLPERRCPRQVLEWSRGEEEGDGVEVESGGGAVVPPRLRDVPVGEDQPSRLNEEPRPAR